MNQSKFYHRRAVCFCPFTELKLYAYLLSIQYVHMHLKHELTLALQILTVC